MRVYSLRVHPIYMKGERMAYITPNGVITLYKGINLNNEYTHTLYFASQSARDTFFNNYPSAKKITFNAQSYTRVNKETVKVHVNAETVQDVTYMKFNNRGGMNYYAFVIGINYINENTTEIVYEIDIMQTWFFKQDCGINPCYIKRMHILTSEDSLKNNLEPEPVGSDLYRFDDVTPDNAGSFGGYNVVINTTDEVTNVNDMVKDGVLCGSRYWSSPIANHLGDIARHINESLGGWDKNEQKADITDIYMFPSKFVTQNTETYHVPFKREDASHSFNYPVRNKKMYTYPYSFLFATTKGGSATQYKWESFDENISTDPTGAEFRVVANSTGGGSVICYPKDYEGITDHTDNKLLCCDFPKCSWALDAYQAFVASGGQTKVNAQWKIDTLGIINSGIETVETGLGAIQSYKNSLQFAGMTAISWLAGSASGMGKSYALAKDQQANMFKQLSDTVQQGISTYAQYSEAKNKKDFAFADAKYAPNILVGSQIPNIAVGDGQLGFYFFNAHIEPHEAVRIDNFLTMFGYAINNVATPRLTGRSHWNFIQTQGAQIFGDMPASSKTAIARIFDGGIFMWNSNGNAETVNANIGNFLVQQVSTAYGTQIVND